MSDPIFLRFGGCELHLPRRELKVNGEGRALPPKVYDLLVLLLLQRERVVPKHELADVLWPGLVLTDSVLARTVMKARRAVGDSGGEPQWIRTIHGVGYRFVGEVTSETAPSTAAAQSAAQRSGLRIAVLPCVNASGDPGLDWTQIGLMSLVVHALEQDPRLAPVPAMSILEALPRAPASMLPKEHAQLAYDALGVAHVVRATVRRQGASLWLDYWVFSRGADAVSGSLRDRDAVALGQRLAKAVNEAVFPGRSPPMRFVSLDAFVNQAFARGMELLAQEDWSAAAPLFAVVCAAEPDSIVALRWRMQCLAVLRDEAAVPLGHALLERAAAADDVKMQAIAHALLALALMQPSGPQAADACRAHAAEALRLADGREHESWVIWHRVQIATHAVFTDNGQHVLPLLNQAETACRTSGNDWALGQVQRLLGVIDLCSGNLLRARERLDESTRIHRRLRHVVSSAHSIGLLGLVNASLGQLDTAFAQCDETVSLLSELRSPGWDGLALSAAARLYVARGAATQVECALAAFEGIANQDHPLVRAPVLATSGCLAMCRGDVAAARAALQGAVEHSSGTISAIWVRIWLMLLVRLEIAAGDAVAVAAVCRQITSLPGYARDVERKGCVMHAQAAELHALGHVPEAVRFLEKIIEEVPLGYEHACARLDAAWLSLECGELHRAGQLLASVTSWCEEYPAGLATKARLHFGLGELDAAVAAQRLALESFQAVAPCWHHEALRVYTAAAAGGVGVLAPLPWLVSDSWFPQPAAMEQRDRFAGTSEPAALRA